MQVKNIALAAVLAAVFAGNAMAVQPAAGEGPLFQNEAVTASSVSRAEVVKEAIANPPSADTGNVFAQKAAPAKSDTARTTVRSQTRDAIAHGYQVKSGEKS